MQIQILDYMQNNGPGVHDHNSKTAHKGLHDVALLEVSKGLYLVFLVYINRKKQGSLCRKFMHMYSGGTECLFDVQCEVVNKVSLEKKFLKL